MCFVTSTSSKEDEAGEREREDAAVFVSRGSLRPTWPTKHTLFTASKQKRGFPIMAIKAVLSAINIFSPGDRDEKNGPLTDTACEGGRADLLKKRPVSPEDPSPPSAFFPLYMSQYLGDLRRAACVCVCIVEVLPSDSVPCWRWGGGGR